MEVKGVINIVNKVLTYDTTVEKEKRYKISTESFRDAVSNGEIKIYDAVKIEQVWFGKSDKYTARVRKTIKEFNFKGVREIIYEHTVKHHISPTMDYEVTTDLTERDYELLRKLYKDENCQIKLRFYVRAIDGSDENYIATVDMPYDEPGICWVEFELKNANVNNSDDNKNVFVKPDWVKVIR